MGIVTYLTADSPTSGIKGRVPSERPSNVPIDSERVRDRILR